ncbi:hypothetical protein ACTMSW_29340 [Micromonospora sp. BQ11]|uniref:hypothetical protein n=1 Tax=Micromonospora sp. BQ11 TaxID=3452212 RepID=UPI003F8B46B0
MAAKAEVDYNSDGAVKTWPASGCAPFCEGATTVRMIDGRPLRRPWPCEEGHRGLWLAQQRRGTLVIDTSALGTTVCVSAVLRRTDEATNGRP